MLWWTIKYISFLDFKNSHVLQIDRTRMYRQFIYVLEPNIPLSSYIIFKQRWSLGSNKIYNVEDKTVEKLIKTVGYKMSVFILMLIFIKVETSKMWKRENTWQFPYKKQKKILNVSKVIIVVQWGLHLTAILIAAHLELYINLGLLRKSAAKV